MHRRKPPLRIAAENHKLVWTLLVAITVLAGALRFTKLGAQSLWEDEAVTADHIRASFHDMLLYVRSGDSNPPLYFVTAWVWVRVVGMGEVGLRSLSAVVGTATVPIAYYAARTLTTVRAGLLTALFVALSPMLIWYSKEGRAYALVTFLCAASFLFFARTLATYTRLNLTAWAISSIAALTTHYFAGFFVAVEALWLIRRVPQRRALAVAFAPVALVGLALIPLIRDQLHYRPIGDDAIGLVVRVRQLGVWLATGDLRATGPLVTASIVASVGVWLVFRATGRSERHGGLTALGIGLVMIAVPLTAAVLGVDYFLFRNLIPAWLPLAIALAAGFTARRAGLLGVGAATVLCAVFVFADVATLRRTDLQRDDWRSVASMLTQSASPSAVVVYPGWDARPILRYAPSVAPIVGGSVRAREVWFVGVASCFCGQYTSWTSPGKLSFESPSGFRQVSSRRFQHFVIRRFRAPTPTLVRTSELGRLAKPSSGQIVPNVRVLAR